MRISDWSSDVCSSDLALRVDEDPELVALHGDAYIAMIDTAENVARRYGVSRAAQDEYSLQSQQRTAAAQAAGLFQDEIVPVTATMIVTDKATGEKTSRIVTLTQDEGNRADTTQIGRAHV